MNSSFLSRLRAINTRRSWLYYPQCEDWSDLEWAGAAIGECGEVTNVAKKMTRGNGNQQQLKEHLAEEIADTVIYLDLLCAKHNIDLEQAIRSKFNRISAELGFEEVL
jgi:NTP pyrophosphatase (non-canonical NTP hydrolase)